MVKQIIGGVIIILTVLSFGACSRCMTCTVVDSSGDQVYTQDVCGNRSTINFFQTNVNSTYPDSSGFVVTCVEVQ